MTAEHILPLPSLREAATMLLSALDKFGPELWAPWENEAGEEVGEGLDAATSALRAALALPDAEPMADLWKLHDDFKRLSAVNRKKYASSGHEKWKGMELAYTAAAQKVQQCTMIQPAQPKAVDRVPLRNLDAQHAFNAWNLMGDSADTDAFFRLKIGDKIERAFLDGLRSGEALHSIKGAA